MILTIDSKYIGNSILKIHGMLLLCYFGVWLSQLPLFYAVNKLQVQAFQSNTMQGEQWDITHLPLT